VILLGLFSVLALLLSALGIYGVLSHAVARRTHEIGVRVALGAGHRAVVWLVVRQAMALVLVGLGAGTVASLALGRWVRALLFGVTATDPWGFVASALLLAAVAAAAAWVPACRAVLVDPCEALRAE
jgi:putative ABC transport system permease protein